MRYLSLKQGCLGNRLFTNMAAFGSYRRIERTGFIWSNGIFLLLVASCQFVGKFNIFIQGWLCIGSQQSFNNYKCGSRYVCLRFSSVWWSVFHENPRRLDA